MARRFPLSLCLSSPHNGSRRTRPVRMQTGGALDGEDIVSSQRTPQRIISGRSPSLGTVEGRRRSVLIWGAPGMLILILLSLVFSPFLGFNRARSPMIRRYVLHIITGFRPWNLNTIPMRMHRRRHLGRPHMRLDRIFLCYRLADIFFFTLIQLVTFQPLLSRTFTLTSNIFGER